MTHEVQVGDYRLIPEGTSIWSISAQTLLVVAQSEIVKVNATCTHGNDIFVTPHDLCSPAFGHLSLLSKRGTDEWVVDVAKTLPHNMGLPYKSPEKQVQGAKDHDTL